MRARAVRRTGWNAVGLDPLNVSLNRNLGLYCLGAGSVGKAPRQAADRHGR